MYCLNYMYILYVIIVMTAAVNMSVNNFDKILNTVHPQINRRNWRCISSLIYISIFSAYLFDKVINAKSIYMYL